MKTYHPPGLTREETVTFQGIPENQFREKVNEINRKLRRKMRENEIREAQSIRFASGFVSTPPMDDE